METLAQQLQQGTLGSEPSEPLEGIAEPSVGSSSSAGEGVAIGSMPGREALQQLVASASFRVQQRRIEGLVEELEGARGVIERLQRELAEAQARA